MRYLIDIFRCMNTHFRLCFWRIAFLFTFTLLSPIGHTLSITCPRFDSWIGWGLSSECQSQSSNMSNYIHVITLKTCIKSTNSSKSNELFLLMNIYIYIVLNIMLYIHNYACNIKKVHTLKKYQTKREKNPLKTICSLF